MLSTLFKEIKSILISFCIKLLLEEISINVKEETKSLKTDINFLKLEN